MVGKQNNVINPEKFKASLMKYEMKYLLIFAEYLIFVKVFFFYEYKKFTMYLTSNYALLITIQHYR